MAAGAAGSWPHCVLSQETEPGECCFAAHLLFYFFHFFFIKFTFRFTYQPHFPSSPSPALHLSPAHPSSTQSG